MSSRETRERVRKFGESLRAPFRRRRSRSSSPIPTPIPRPAFSDTPASNPHPISGPSASTVSSSTLAGPLHSIGGQSPNLQSPAISVPLKNEAFKKAIHNYIDNLSYDDKIAFQSATDVLEKLEELQRGKPSTPSTHSSRMQKVQKVLQCVKQFLGSVAICIQHSPEISSLVVGGLNCILTLALGYIEFFESLANMMERIGDHLTYLSEYATGSIAFQNSEKVQKALVATYCDLLDFYVKVRKLFTHKEGKLSYAQGFKRFLRVTWEPFEAEFQSMETRFTHHTNIVVRLAGAEHLIHYYTRQEDEKLGERRRKILEWLSLHDFEETYERHFRKLFQGTGEWLLGDPRFIIWRDAAQSRLLWCYGAPGSGKTILASLVIDHLSARHELSEDIGITFIYCSYTVSLSPQDYIRLAIKQLCRRIKPLPPKLDKVYEQHYNNYSQPGFQELQDIFLATIQQFRSVFFILDALDECTLDQRADLCEFFARIVELNASTGTGRGLVKLFVASRKELDIERAFQRESFPKIEIEATKVDSDIALYVNAQIEQRLHGGSLTLNNMALKDKILDALTTSSGGMFLWVEFQLKAICAQVSDYGIEETLQNIPRDIEATYNRILESIDKKPPAQRELAKKALLFTAYATEPVSIDILALAIAVKDHTQSLDMLRSSISSEKTILDACGNLLSIDNTDSSVRRACFTHFSVHEFLTSHRSKLLHTLILDHEVAHREIAQMCMSFLLILYSELQDYCTTIESTFANNYILPALPQHLLAGNLSSLSSNDEMINLTSLFFEKGPPLLVQYDEPHLSLSYTNTNFFGFSPPVLALVFNLPGTHECYNSHAPYGKQLDQMVLTWIHGRVHGSRRNLVRVSDNRFVMHYATGQLNSVIVSQRLYTHGYPIEYSYSYSDGPLNTFNTFGLPGWAPDICKRTPFYLVKSEEVARFLLDSGASVNPQNTNYGLPNLVGHLTTGGNTKVIQLLLDGGAEQDEETQGSALQTLAYDGKVEAIRLLLDNGVDVNMPGGEYGNALHAAACNGHVEAMRLLLDRGADVNAQGGFYGNPLQAAAHNGKVEAVRLLLDNSAYINAQGGMYGNALQTAVCYNHVNAVQLLLDMGADVNAQGGMYGNALQAAVCHSHVNTVQLLLDMGADVNAQGGTYVSALSAAVIENNVKVMQLLLEMGADVNAQGGYYGNVLEAAAAKGFVEALQLLLDKGADINARGGDFGDVLQAAVYYRKVKAVQFLLDKGADVNVQGGYYGNALQAAVHTGNIEVMRLLLDKGANVNAQGGKYGNALQAAIDNGNAKAIRLLLDRGARLVRRVEGMAT